MTIEYVLYGEPVPLPRARVTRFGTFTPKRARDAKARHTEAAGLAMPEGWPLDGRYALHVIAYRGTARRCDGDNLLKLVLDALNRSAFNDDSQVDVMHVEKRIDAAEPRTEVLLALIHSREAG